MPNTLDRATRCRRVIPARYRVPHVSVTRIVAGQEATVAGQVATYAYGIGSQLSRNTYGGRLGLATSGGTELHDGALRPVGKPFFFSGFVEHPGVVATALLVVARVARTRFYAPPTMLSAVLRAADPVVTVTPASLRFESFSACCGVYARLDLDASGLDASHHRSGVTNVDVNPPLREALAGLRTFEPLHLDVGDTELRVTTMAGEVVEEQVPLPSRWLKGFAEAQLLSSTMVAQHDLDAVTARAFIRALPRSSPTRSVMWATRAVTGVRLATRPTPGAACVAGPERLRVLEPLLALARGIRAYGPPAGAASPPLASAWVLDLPGGRLTVALSPEKSRGFSGEGGVLTGLTSPSLASDGERIADLLALDSEITTSDLTSRFDLPEARVRDALGWLAGSGQVGYDVAAGSYFHRPLPLDTTTLETMHSRLSDARSLVAAGAVTLGPDGHHRVTSGGTTYQVRTERDGSSRCSCPWYARYRDHRGPCKHQLAVRLVAEGTDQ